MKRKRRKRKKVKKKVKKMQKKKNDKNENKKDNKKDNKKNGKKDDKKLNDLISDSDSEEQNESSDDESNKKTTKNVENLISSDRPKEQKNENIDIKNQNEDKLPDLISSNDEGELPDLISSDGEKNKSHKKDENEKLPDLISDDDSWMTVSDDEEEEKKTHTESRNSRINNEDMEDEDMENEEDNSRFGINFLNTFNRQVFESFDDEYKVEVKYKDNVNNIPEKESEKATIKVDKKPENTDNNSQYVKYDILEKIDLDNIITSIINETDENNEIQKNETQEKEIKIENIKDVEMDESNKIENYKIIQTDDKDNNSIMVNDEKKIVEEIFEIEQFEIVSDIKDHFFKSQEHQITPKFYKTIQKEWRLLKENLPNNIYVHAFEGRIDLLRAIMIGPKNTPYYNGIFTFDIYLPEVILYLKDRSIHLPLRRSTIGPMETR
jgi:hypothetical protein